LRELGQWPRALYCSRACCAAYRGRKFKESVPRYLAVLEPVKPRSPPYGTALPLFDQPTSIERNWLRCNPHPQTPSFTESLRLIWRRLRGVQPDWRQRAREAKLVEALAAALRPSRRAGDDRRFPTDSAASSVARTG
jgi:hypothetical protein